MNYALVLAGLVVLVVATALVARRLSRRPKTSLAKPEDLVSLRTRIAGVIEACGEKKPAVVAMLRVAEHFLERASHSLEFEHTQRARLHMNLVAITLTWAETTLEEPLSDTPHARTTKRLGLALAYLKQNSFEAAEREFEAVWLDEYSHLQAKRLALMGRLWLHASRGEHDEAAQDEMLLITMPAIAAMPGVTMETTVERD